MLAASGRRRAAGCAALSSADRSIRRRAQSVRIAPPLVGRAALERIDPAAILALADPDDRDGDGISGRARMVDVADGRRSAAIGWKAGNADARRADRRRLRAATSACRAPSARCRTATARRCRPDCLAAPTGAEPERRRRPDDTTQRRDDRPGRGFLRALPAARHGEPRSRAAALRRRRLRRVPCARRLPRLAGGDVAALFSDLLLHDMGPALDDGVGEPGALRRNGAPRRSIALSGRRPALSA